MRAACAAGLLALPLAALPARAAECVRVVVDYGTFDDAPASAPNTVCVSSSGTAAEVLATRASAIGAPAPTYRGNFLCSIDGYPKDVCGNSGTQPYWSFWLWVDGKWTYSSLGVDSYTVRDADRDGHPDPMGFRYHEFETKRQPRANPSYPAPTTRPPTAPPRATTAPPRQTTAPSTAPNATAGAGRTAGAPTGGATGEPAGPGTATGAPGAGGATPTATADGAAPTSTPGSLGTPGTEDAGGAGGGEPVAGAPPVFDKPESAFPWGALGGGVLALGLIGAGAYRARRP